MIGTEEDLFRWHAERLGKNYNPAWNPIHDKPFIWGMMMQFNVHIDRNVSTNYTAAYCIPEGGFEDPNYSNHMGLSNKINYMKKYMVVDRCPEVAILHAIQVKVRNDK